MTSILVFKEEKETANGLALSNMVERAWFDNVLTKCIAMHHASQPYSLVEWVPAMHTYGIGQYHAKGNVPTIPFMWSQPTYGFLKACWLCMLIY